MDENAELSVTANMVDMTVCIEQNQRLVCQCPDRGRQIPETKATVDHCGIFRSDDQLCVTVFAIHKDAIYAFCNS